MIVEVVKCDGCGVEIQGELPVRYRYAGKPECHLCEECAGRFQSRERAYQIVELAKVRPEVAELTYNQAVQAAAMGAEVYRVLTGATYRYRDGAMEAYRPAPGDEPSEVWKRDTGTSGPWRVSKWEDGE